MGLLRRGKRVFLADGKMYIISFSNSMYVILEERARGKKKCLPDIYG